MIALNQLSMAYGQKLLFCNVNLNLNTGLAYALVGANGSGKSTFFKLITGEEEAGEGDVLIPKDATLGWLKQDQFRYEDISLHDVVLQGNQTLWAAIQEKNHLLEKSDWDDKDGIRFAVLEELIMLENGYTASDDIEAILVGLGIPKEKHPHPLKQLSGGYKLRVLLAQVLFQNPSILLLDEPTNHLDIISIQWLETFLKERFTGLIVFISHDVEFIDHLADHILDIDYGEIRKYPGQYQRFLDEKNLIQAQKLSEKRSAEEKIAHMQRFVERFKAKASKAAQARSRMKMIDKIEIPDIMNSSRIAPHFHFTIRQPSGKQVCKIDQLGKSFQGQVLFDALRFEIHRGDKIAILGPNGSGKSTLIKTLIGQVQPDQGVITWGSEVKISYFSQDHHEQLTISTPVLTWLTDQVAQVNEQQIRQTLGQVLFSKDDVQKDILTLSGGEAARLLLAKMMLERPNVIVLDEPTNHMDLESIEELAIALSNYNGTVIVVSHNRHFIERLHANRIIYFTGDQRVLNFNGSYQAWVEKH